MLKKDIKLGNGCDDFNINNARCMSFSPKYDRFAVSGCYITKWYPMEY